jgi:hypothetical protein
MLPAQKKDASTSRLKPQQRHVRRRLSHNFHGHDDFWSWYEEAFGEWNGGDLEPVIPDCGAGGPLPTEEELVCTGSFSMIPSRNDTFAKVPLVGNLTYDDLAALHALWLFDRLDYETTSPVFDVDGTLNEQDSGIDGVHFLTPNGEPTACLTTMVSSDDVLFFDIASTIYLTFPSDTEDDWFGPLRSFPEYAGFPDVSNLSNEDLTLIAARLTTTFEQNLTMRAFLDDCELNVRTEYAVSNIFQLQDSNFFGPGTYGAAGGYYGAIGPLPSGTYTLRIVVENNGINYAADPMFYTIDGSLSTFASDNEFQLLVD